MTFQWAIGFKGLRYDADVRPSPQSGTSRKKFVCIGIFMKPITLRLVFGLPQFLLLSALIKEASVNDLQEKQLYTAS